MIFEEAKELARQDIKFKHTYFAANEFMTMKGNLIFFEDGFEIFLNELSKGKDYLKD